MLKLLRGLADYRRRLRAEMKPVFEKLAFSCWRDDPIKKHMIHHHETGRPLVIIAGIESHVCVQRTAIDLLAAGYRVYLAADAIGARFEIDHRYALERMNASGATLTTVESALFELCQVAGTPEFKQLSQLIRQSLGS